MELGSGDLRRNRQSQHADRPAQQDLTGKLAEQVPFGKVDITVNKNMVPFDDKSPFITSGIRIGTPAMTTRGIKEKTPCASKMQLIDEALMNHDKETEAGQRPGKSAYVYRQVCVVLITRFFKSTIDPIELVH